MKKLLMFAVVGLLLTALATPAEAARPLYAGTSYPGVVYKYDGTTWTAISSVDAPLGFAVLDIIEFEGDLYVATMVPAQVLRYDGGTNWILVWTPPDGDESQVCDLEVWNGDLYAGTAWTGGNLYCYNAATDTFDYVGTPPDKDSGGLPEPDGRRWSGIRAMYPWSKTGDLILGDIGQDSLGRYNGTNMIHDAFLPGSCIYDFAEFGGRLYAGAYAGWLIWSSTGIGHSWIYACHPGKDFIWELEVFRGDLYTGDYEGNLWRFDASNWQLVWKSGSYEQEICSMVADEDSVLYFGTGGEAGSMYDVNLYGIARVYTYDGSNEPVEIFDADGGDTDGTDHAGVQVLYLVPSVPRECFGVNHLKIGTEPPGCKGITLMVVTSDQGVFVYDPESGKTKLEANTIVDDGVNGPVKIHTSCSKPIEIGDVYGAYEITDLVKIPGDNPKVDIKGTFIAAEPIDLSVDDVTYTIKDAFGNTLTFSIPADSFEVDGLPEEQKFKFQTPEGIEPGIKAKFDLGKCKFDLKAKKVQDALWITPTSLAVELKIGDNVGEEAVEVEVKSKHLDYKRMPKLECCPKCKGITLMKVTTDQGVFVYEPEPGKTKLMADTIVDDGVNGPVKIHTSCSKPIEIGDVYGAYTITDLVKIFD